MKTIIFGDENTGVSVEYYPSKKRLNFTGWYDGGYGGMEGWGISLEEFKEKLGIK